MPKRKTHALVGTMSGIALSAKNVRHKKSAPAFAELLGGGVGGYWSSSLPDVIDPPTSPNHRGIGHSASLATAIAAIGFNNLEFLQEKLRSWADEFERKAELAQTDVDRIVYSALQLVCHLGAGLVAGVLAGYLSHVALDALSPRSLPLLSRY